MSKCPTCLGRVAVGGDTGGTQYFIPLGPPGWKLKSPCSTCGREPEEAEE